MLIVREGVEAEVEEALTISFAYGVGEKEAQQALLVLRMGLAEQASERPEGSHFVLLSARQPRRGGEQGGVRGCSFWSVWHALAENDVQLRG